MVISIVDVPCLIRYNIHDCRFYFHVILSLSLHIKIELNRMLIYGRFTDLFKAKKSYNFFCLQPTDVKRQKYKNSILLWACQMKLLACIATIMT